MSNSYRNFWCHKKSCDNNKDGDDDKVKETILNYYSLFTSWKCIVCYMSHDKKNKKRT